LSMTGDPSMGSMLVNKNAHKSTLIHTSPL
jgi:hypothetical protein